MTTDENRMGGASESETVKAPLGAAEFSALASGWTMPKAGIEFVERAKAGFVGRWVQGRTYVETRVQAAIQAYLRVLEQDHSVLACYEQAGKLMVRWVLEGAIFVTTEYPEILVVTRHGVTLVTIQPLRALKKQVVDRPYRWRGDEESGFRDAAAEEAAARLGMRYRVLSVEEVTELNKRRGISGGTV